MATDRTISLTGLARLLPLLALVLPIATPARAQTEPGLIAYLKNSEGKVMGRVHLVPSLTGVSGKVEINRGLTPGEHGMHIHTTGKCDAADFASAGGHFNPDGKAHGLKNPQGAHLGDLPAIKVGANGKAVAYFNVKASMSALLDKDGAAVIVHAAGDDQMTDPSGNSGARLLCGILVPGYF